jgi:hypothetical protein
VPQPFAAFGAQPGLEPQASAAGGWAQFGTIAEQQAPAEWSPFGDQGPGETAFSAFAPYAPALLNDTLVEGEEEHPVSDDLLKV